MGMKNLLENFRGFAELEESANTIAADVNEILLAYMLADESGTFVNEDEAAVTLKDRASQLTPEQYEDQKGRAQAMVEPILQWAADNAFGGTVAKVWWTARPGVLQAAVGSREASAGNPTDVLVQFGDESFLGISAKSTKGPGDIGFKNPGIGSIGKALNVDLGGVLTQRTADALASLKLSHLTAKARKPVIRANAETKAKAEALGYEFLTILRDFLANHLSIMSQEDLRNHLLGYWLDAGENYPYYIKVTGRGSQSKGFGAALSDPIKNEKYKALMADELEVVTVEDHSVGILAGGKRILKMRFKYESQKLASSIKMSGDPW